MMIRTNGVLLHEPKKVRLIWLNKSVYEVFTQVFTRNRESEIDMTELERLRAT